LIIAALALARRRWPLAVVLASSATLQVYYLSDCTSTYAAVPLSVALATAWAAGHRHRQRWAWAACWAALIASVGYSLTLGWPWPACTWACGCCGAAGATGPRRGRRPWQRTRPRLLAIIGASRG
jgi:hypothetical protein